MLTIIARNAPRSRPRHWRAGLVLLGALALLPAAAQAFNKCTVDGKIVFQDAPCPETMESEAQAMRRKEHYRELERKLDVMQAKGYGTVQRKAPEREADPVAPPDSGPRYFVGQPRSRAAREAKQREFQAELQEKALRNNAKSAATLTRILDQAKEECGEMLDYPKVGMSDDAFRNCTTHARFGGVTQIVVSEDGDVPLRLYVFPTQRAARVYAIGGVITTIKP